MICVTDTLPVGLHNSRDGAIALSPSMFSASAPTGKKVGLLQCCWMNADDNPRFAKDPSLYFAFNQKLNEKLRHLFQKLGYDGFVYRNEIESGDSVSDSYCVSDENQVAVEGEEMVQYANARAQCAA